MRATSTRALAIGVGAWVLSGCQLLAGVRSDAEVDTAARCEVAADCPSGVCQDGVCQAQTAACTADLQPFDILSSADLADHDIDAGSLLLVHDGDRAHVAVVDEVASRLVVRSVRELGGEALGALAEFPFTAAARFVSGRAAGAQVAFQGRMGDAIGQVVFPTSADGVASTGTFEAFPTLMPTCTSPNVAEPVAFAFTGAETRYAATCGQPGGQTRALVVGRTDEPNPAVVIEGEVGDPSFEVEHYAVTNGEHLILVGSSDAGESLFRAGPEIADLAVATPIRFTDAPAELELHVGAVPLPSGDGITLMMGQYTPPPMLSLAIWAGVVTDPQRLAQMPPPDMKPIFSIEDPDLLGAPSPLTGEDDNLYLTLTPPAGKSVLLNWTKRDGTPILAMAPVYTVPEGDTATLVLGSGVVQIGFKVLIAWIEQSEGSYAVRGQRLICQY